MAKVSVKAVSFESKLKEKNVSIRIKKKENKYYGRPFSLHDKLYTKCLEQVNQVTCSLIHMAALQKAALSKGKGWIQLMTAFHVVIMWPRKSINKK